MGTKLKPENKKTATVVETDRESRQPFSVLNRKAVLSRPEFEVFDAIREAVPVVSAAIEKIIRLVGNFTVECDSSSAERELELFLNNIPTGACNRGIGSFVGSFLDSLLMYGTAVGEIACTKSGHIAGLYNAPLKGIEILKGDNPFECQIAVRGAGGKSVPVKHPERVFMAAANPTTDSPFGRSILDGLPFVTGILLKIFDSIGTNFERLGNLRYAVTYRPQNESDAAFGADRASEIAREWSAAMSSKDGVRDFVAVGDVDIKVIGADNQIIDSEIPVRQILEQIVAKLGLPPFMLGLSWSTTERMSTQQADILTSELWYYRGLLTPIIEKICRSYLRQEGFTSDFKINWSEITLQDEVEEARARLLNAQSSALEREEVK